MNIIYTEIFTVVELFFGMYLLQRYSRFSLKLVRILMDYWSDM